MTPPGSLAKPDNQGQLEVCTRLAISKSLVDGLMRKIFVPGHEIDNDQDNMTTALLQEHKDGDGKWPHEFHNKTYQLMDRVRRHWRLTLSVKMLQTSNEFISDIGQKLQNNTYVMVYPLNPSNPAGAKHCIYARGYDPVTQEVLCINSDPNDPMPRISITYPGLIFYKVSCLAKEMKKEMVRI